MLKLYQNIKNRRIALGMTQGELAAKVGYSDKSMIARIESGKVDLPQSKISTFASALGASASDLMGWNGNELCCLSPARVKLLSLFDGESEEEILAFYEVTKALLYLRSRNGNTKED